MAESKPKQSSYAFAMAAVALWGSTAVMIRHLSILGVSASFTAFVRCVFGGSILLLGLKLSGYRTWDWHRLSRNRWMWLAIVCYGGNMLVFHGALSYTSASVVMLLENTAPLTALLGGVFFFQEHLTARTVFALLLAMLGVWLTCGADTNVLAGDNPWFGKSLALLAGVTWAGYTLSCSGLAKSTTGTGPAIQAMGVMLIGSAVLISPTQIYASWSVPVAALPWLLVLSILHTSIATTLWRLAMDQIPAFVASLLFLLTIVLTIVFDATFLNEKITSRLLMGATAILGSLIIAMRRDDMKRPAAVEATT